eukprot:tig00020510_g9795.t1
METSGTAEAPAPFDVDGLAVDVIADILERLGLRGAAIARAVSRRWRAAAGAVLWRRLDVVADERASAAVGRGRGPRPAVDPRRPRRVAARGGGGDWRATLSLVSAVAAASGGGGGGGLGEADVACPSSSAAGAGAGANLGDLLCALAPPGAAARPALRSLALRRGGGDYEDHEVALGIGQLPRPVLFPNLESLSLDVLCRPADRPAADALALCLPRLKRLEVCCEDLYEVASGAGAFPALEHLTAKVVEDGGDAGPLLEGLASGPAARSVKEVVLGFAEGGAPRGEFELSPEAFQALPRLAALETLRGPLGVYPEVEPTDLAALAACRALRTLGELRACHEGDALAVFLRGLAGPVGLSMSLRNVELALDSKMTPAALEGLRRLARFAQGRLHLTMEVYPDKAWAAAAAAALAAAPPRRLALRVFAGQEAITGGGLLEGLAAFAGCPAGQLEVHIRAPLWDAQFRAAMNKNTSLLVARTLPSARIVEEYPSS